MISSKKTEVIALLLVALVITGIILAMIVFPDVQNTSGIIAYSDSHSIAITQDDYYTTYSEDTISKINLNGVSASSDNKYVQIDGGNVTIKSAGVYVISGTLDNGSITIDGDSTSDVRLVLGGVDITSSDFCAIYVKQCKKTVISLVPGTKNILSDASEYSGQITTDSKTKAALYSKDDLVINGEGELIVNGNSDDGIKANDSLKIINATVSVRAVDEGINVNDYIYMSQGTVWVESGGDGIKCEHEDISNGFAAMENSTVSVTSEGDGIYASSGLYINNTAVNVTSGGGLENAAMTTSFERGGFGGVGVQQQNSLSTKAIKAGTNVVINGGTYSLDSSDDSIHSDGDLTIEKGTFSIKSGNDAVHADMNVVLKPETMDISYSYEGLEGAYITINGGDIRIVSNDDGINATGENSNGGMPMRPGSFGGEEKTSDEDIWLTVNGGNIYIETSGDGFDSNGSAVINDGFVEVYGPENSGNGSIDVGDGGYVLIMNGGKLLAAGSSGMAEYPTESSPQKSLVFYLEKNYQRESSISIKDRIGNEIISGISGKSFNWICLSAPDITDGETYTLYIDETEVATVTATRSVAVSGTRIGGFGNGRGRW